LVQLSILGVTREKTESVTRLVALEIETKILYGPRWHAGNSHVTDGLTGNSRLEVSKS